MFPIPRPKRRPTRRRPGRNQRIAKLRTVAPPILANVLPRQTPCLRIDRNTDQHPKKIFYRCMLLGPRSRP